MSMTFKDRIHLAALIITLVVFGHYFYHAYAVVSIIVAVSIVLAVVGRKATAQPEDERDRLYGLLATRNGHFALLLGLVAMFVALYLGATVLQLANIVLLAWVVAECVKSASLIMYARVGE